MIEIKLTDSILRKHKLWVFGDNLLKENRLYSRLNAAVDTEEDAEVKEVLKFIFDNIEDVLIGDIKTLNNIKETFDTMLSKLKRQDVKLINRKDGKGEKEVYLYWILGIFLDEYKYFYDSANWNAYMFQIALDITICPYCATQFIFVYRSESGKGKTRGTLDHFFDKGKYPFLAVSIYNLVPSCKVCNSDLKGKKSVELNNNYSPYEDGITKYIRFKREIIPNMQQEVPYQANQGSEEENDIDFVSVFTGASNDFNLIIDYSSAPVEIYPKIEGNINLFHLEKIYNSFHKSYVQSIIKKASIYNYAYRKQLTAAYSVFFSNEDELKATLIPAIADDRKNILGKLTREIIEDETNGFSF
ncbi:hypothetical protein [Sporosarcina ureae]|uniref:hypothetical protein n=1 Tax=Sporosarcina ureae TaxID=1571 RepID=UPI0028A9F81D|nr:hypothetical protein [Sporosarcina ureae]